MLAEFFILMQTSGALLHRTTSFSEARIAGPCKPRRRITDARFLQHCETAAAFSPFRESFSQQAGKPRMNAVSARGAEFALLLQ
jgi:hypothetical protein